MDISADRRVDLPRPRSDTAATLSMIVLVGVALLSPGGTATASQAMERGVDPDLGSLVEAGCDEPERRRFDFWIGDWDVVNRQRNPARPEDATLYETGTATNRVYAVLDGCAIVEHWEGHLLPDRHVLGFSVRAWHPGREAWVALLNWPGPGGPGFTVMEGTFADSVATFLSDTPSGRRIRYRFQDVRPDRFRWSGARRDSEDGRWSTFWIMDFRRRDPVRDPALFNGPSRSTAHCPQERARAFDFLIGDWSGALESDESGPTRPVALRTWPILEGCAIMEFLRIGEGDAARRRLRIRSFVPREDRWVQYTVRRRSPVLVRWEGAPTDDRTLARVTPVLGEPPTRALYREIASDAFVRELQVRDGEGRAWRTVSRMSLGRRHAAARPVDRSGEADPARAETSLPSRSDDDRGTGTLILQGLGGAGYSPAANVGLIAASVVDNAVGVALQNLGSLLGH